MLCSLNLLSRKGNHGHYLKFRCAVSIGSELRLLFDFCVGVIDCTSEDAVINLSILCVLGVLVIGFSFNGFPYPMYF